MHVVFSTNSDGALGPNEFSGFFYQKFWDIIANDIFHYMLQFFSQSCILPNLNSNLINSSLSQGTRG